MKVSQQFCNINFQLGSNLGFVLEIKGVVKRKERNQHGDSPGLIPVYPILEQYEEICINQLLSIACGIRTLGLCGEQWLSPLRSFGFWWLVSSCVRVLHLLQMRQEELTFVRRSVQFSCSVVSDSLRPRGLQHARPLCPSPTPGVYSNSCPLSW